MEKGTSNLLQNEAINHESLLCLVFICPICGKSLPEFHNNKCEGCHLNEFTEISKNKCPRGTKCEPISNIISDSSFVCIGLHNELKKNYPQDRFRHCFKSAADTDSMFDYDEYDIKSVINVMSEALLIDGKNV